MRKGRPDRRQALLRLPLFQRRGRHRSLAVKTRRSGASHSRNAATAAATANSQRGSPVAVMPTLCRWGALHRVMVVFAAGANQRAQVFAQIFNAALSNFCQHVAQTSLQALFKIWILAATESKDRRSRKEKNETEKRNRQIRWRKRFVYDRLRTTTPFGGDPQNLFQYSKTQIRGEIKMILTWTTGCYATAKKFSLRKTQEPFVLKTINNICLRLDWLVLIVTHSTEQHSSATRLSTLSLPQTSEIRTATCYNIRHTVRTRHQIFLI